MNYTSLLALCSLMLLVPSCGKGGSTTTTTQSDIKVEPMTAGTSVEVKEETAQPGEATATEKDKENLEEAELTEVVVKK